MPTNVTCPHCSRPASVPEALLGKEVKCPSCGATFTAAAPADAPSPLEPEPLGVAGGQPGMTASAGASTPTEKPKEVNLIGNFVFFGGIWACVLPLLCCS